MYEYVAAAETDDADIKAGTRFLARLASLLSPFFSRCLRAFWMCFIALFVNFMLSL